MSRRTRTRTTRRAEGTDGDLSSISDVGEEQSRDAEAVAEKDVKEIVRRHSAAIREALEKLPFVLDAQA
jgi:hypothetical protein